MQYHQPARTGGAAHRLLLVDGYGFLFRAYHSLPPLTNAQGVPVGAVYGFMNMLVKLLSAKEADYVAVVLDAGKKTFRHQMYESYKANRPPAPDDLIPQFSLVREAITALNLPVLEVEGYEADDVIATYAKRAVTEGIEVTIVSGDKDLTQLITPEVKLYDPLKLRYITPEYVKEKYGVLPERMLDLLALTGDSSDNIPGVPGIGPKTAAQLLEEFGSLEDILAKAGTIKQEKRRQSLLQHRENALLSKDLVQLCTTVPLDRPITTLTVTSPDMSILTQFLATHGFKTLLARLEKEGFIQKNSQAALSSNQPALQPLPISLGQVTAKVQVIQEEAMLSAWVQQLSDAAILALYIHQDKKTHHPSLIALATDKGAVALVLLAADQQGRQADLFHQAAAAPGILFSRVVSLLTPALQSSSLLKVGYDMKCLLRVLWQQDIAGILPYDDIMLMSYLLRTGVFEHTLPMMVMQYLGKDNHSYVVLENKKSTKEEIQDALAQIVQDLISLHTHIKHALIEARLVTLYERLEKPLIEVLAQMETAGIKVDVTMLHALSDTFEKDIATLEQQIYALAGKSFNIGSPKQLGEILFVDMGLTGGKKSAKTHLYSTDNEVLEKLASEGIKIAEHLIQWRSFSKLKSTYTDALAKQIQSDGRVHTHYAMAAVNTGRLSSYDPNLQNIPVRTEIGNTIREVFIAEPHHVLLSADYSQIELRLLAHMAQIEPLKAAFHAEQDIHTLTASQVFGIKLEEVTSEMRRRAKAINFGIIYGMSAFGLARRLSIERSDATSYIEAYFKQYPGILTYMEQTKALAREQGFVTTLLGRKCFIKGMQDKQAVVRQFAERAAINAPLQGSAADIIKQAMVNLHPRLKRQYPAAKLLLQVHDELVLEVPEPEVEGVATLVKQTMERVVQLSVPLTVSMGTGKNWRASH